MAGGSSLAFLWAGFHHRRPTIELESPIIIWAPEVTPVGVPEPASQRIRNEFAVNLTAKTVLHCQSPPGHLRLPGTFRESCVYWQMLLDNGTEVAKSQCRCMRVYSCASKSSIEVALNGQTNLFCASWRMRFVPHPPALHIVGPPGLAQEHGNPLRRYC